MAATAKKATTKKTSTKKKGKTSLKVVKTPKVVEADEVVKKLPKGEAQKILTRAATTVNTLAKNMGIFAKCLYEIKLHGLWNEAEGDYANFAAYCEGALRISQAKGYEYTKIYAEYCVGEGAVDPVELFRHDFNNLRLVAAAKKKGLEDVAPESVMEVLDQNSGGGTTEFKKHIDARLQEENLTTAPKGDKKASSEFVELKGKLKGNTLALFEMIRSQLKESGEVTGKGTSLAVVKVLMEIYKDLFLYEDADADAETAPAKAFLKFFHSYFDPDTHQIIIGMSAEENEAIAVVKQELNYDDGMDQDEEEEEAPEEASDDDEEVEEDDSEESDEGEDEGDDEEEEEE